MQAWCFCCISCRRIQLFFSLLDELLLCESSHRAAKGNLISNPQVHLSRKKRGGENHCSNSAKLCVDFLMQCTSVTLYMLGPTHLLFSWLAPISPSYSRSNTTSSTKPSKISFTYLFRLLRALLVLCEYSQHYLCLVHFSSPFSISHTKLWTPWVQVSCF